MTFYANKVIKMSSLFARKNKNIISDILRSMQSSTDFVPDFVPCGRLFHFLWDYWTHCGIFENGVLLMYTQECVSSVAIFITAYEESQ